MNFFSNKINNEFTICEGAENKDKREKCVGYVKIFSN